MSLSVFAVGHTASNQNNATAQSYFWPFGFAFHFAKKGKSENVYTSVFMGPKVQFGQHCIHGLSRVKKAPKTCPKLLARVFKVPREPKARSQERDRESYGQSLCAIKLFHASFEYTCTEGQFRVAIFAPCIQYWRPQFHLRPINTG